MDQKETLSIDDYISKCKIEVQPILQTLREFIQKEAPEATEKISYQMPTFFLYGNLVHFAVAKNHIGFHPGANGVAAFEHKLLGYSYSKGTIRFPLGEELPWDLIRQIVKFRVDENNKKAESKKKK